MKYLKYILIIILLVGFFSPITKISAQSFPNNYNPSNTTPKPVKPTPLASPTSTTTTAPAQPPIILTPASGTSTQVAPAAGNNKNYQLLTQLPCPPGSTDCIPGEKLINVNTETGLGPYLNLMIKIFIGLCAVLSVVMVVVGGLEYMTSELSHSKEAGKEKIRDAILGLLIALGAYALLYTINPDLLKSDLNIPSGTCSVPEFTTAADCAGKGAWTPNATSGGGNDTTVGGSNVKFQGGGGEGGGGGASGSY